MSEFVRKTVQDLVTGANQKNALTSSVNEYSTHVKDLKEKVEKLAMELAILKAGTQPRGVDGTDDDSNETSEKNEVPERQPLDDVEGTPHSAAAEQPLGETTS